MINLDLENEAWSHENNFSLVIEMRKLWEIICVRIEPVYVAPIYTPLECRALHTYLYVAYTYIHVPIDEDKLFLD